MATALRRVLEIIRDNREDEAPVFAAILEQAASLCNVPYAGLALVDASGKELVYAASHGAALPSSRVGARSWPIVPRSAMGQAVLAKCPVRVDDLKDSDDYRNGEPSRVRSVDEDGIRSFMVVPLLLDGRAIGTFGMFKREVAPFTQSDQELVEAFAAQAVIAIENVRQFREVQTRLEREAATSEILEVISRSRDDEKPVFDVVLRNARRLCGASTAALMLGRPDDPHLTLAALSHANPEGAIDIEDRIQRVNQVPMKMDPDVHVSARAICDGAMVHIADLRQTRSYRSGELSFRIMVDENGQRSALSVPLLTEDGAIGAINLHREEPGLFGDDEIALVRTFASQAVIAIENVRQFREVQTRLEREAATREVLQVISQSRDDEMPVFRAILERAQRLCGAQASGLQLVNAARTHLYYVVGSGDDKSSFEIGEEFDLAEPLGMCIAVREARVVHMKDLKDSQLCREGHARRRQLVDVEGVRTQVSVPLIRDGVAFGNMTMSRTEQNPFAEDEIALVETFAEQAVIAIENVRQFKALETLNAELGDRVAEQVGEIERMGRLKRFLPAAVADTVVSKGADKMLSSHRALLGVLFCDIRGFTAFCETAEPEETIEVLQTYHQEMGRLIANHGAGVDHRMGDGIMVLFNDPLPCDDPAGDAVRLAVAMRARMVDLCKGWKRMGHRLGFGVGVSLGYATVGMVGYEGRYDYTASGTAVNLAARLCDMAEDGEILLSPRAQIAVEDDFQTMATGAFQLKGIQNPLEVYRLEAEAAS